MHGWNQEMTDHPAFHWARANGWALMASTELLDVLPEDHPSRAAVLDLYRAQVRGLAACQASVRDYGTSYWTGRTVTSRPRRRQFLSTASRAASTAAGSHPLTYGPMVFARLERGGAKGQCPRAGRGHLRGHWDGFDPAFYYNRPVSPLAAHGYGPEPARRSRDDHAPPR